MPGSSARCPALLRATEGLLTSRWRAQFPYRPYQLHVGISRYNDYSSIADAMLGRAVKKYEPPAPKSNKPNLAKQLFPSSSPSSTPKIDDALQNQRQSTQSLSGFMGGYTNTSKPLQTTSTNVYNNSRARPIKTATPGLSALNKADAFQEPAPTIDLTKDTPPAPRVWSGRDSYMNYIDEFPDDDDIDLDEEPASLPAMPPPTSRGLENASTLPSISTSNTSQLVPEAAVPPSSATTWPSSSPSHKMKPSLAQPKQSTIIDLTQKRAPSGSLAEEKARQVKRRTLPWLQNQAEEDQKIRDMEGRGSAYIEGATCFRCKAPGHYANRCPNPEEAREKDARYTPKSKEPKDMPWNTTASAQKEQQKLLRKKTAKNPTATEDDGREAAKGSAKVGLSPITLSQEQQKVLDLVVNQKKSVFFTGSAGTGKSVLMRAIIAELRKKYARESDRVAVTASTGLAACNIGGVTLHSFGGIGLGKEDVSTLVKKIRRNPKAKQRWQRTQVLVIDEISMVDGDLFDKLEGIARTIRNNGRPFGGIQLVITGDFFQLPPVPESGRDARFAFDAGTWSTTINHTIGLTEVFRQRDPAFANMLNEMRLGNITDETVKAFRRLQRPLEVGGAIEATELFPTRNEVENSNAMRMRNLQGKTYSFRAEDSGTVTDPTQRAKLLSNMMAPEMLTLKKGAQVMLIKNIDETLVNGSLGKVRNFMSEKTFEIYEEDEGAVDNDEDNDIELRDTDPLAFESRMKLRAKLHQDSLVTTTRQYPVVRFILGDGTSRDLLCQPEDWKVELPSGEVQVQRKQVPLILAWALSIHKAQGQTLERVKVDLGKVFEKGQAYVALSRATCQEGLQVLRFDKRKVMAHPKVGDFYNSLYSVNRALEHPKLAAKNTMSNFAKSAPDYEKDIGMGKMDKSKAHIDLDFDADEEAAFLAYG